MVGFHFYHDLFGSGKEDEINKNRNYKQIYQDTYF
jgi:hypothetical protein